MTRIELSYRQYPKGAVFQSLKKSILEKDYETACHWMAEIDLSNWHSTFWEKMIQMTCRDIHINNPRLPQLIHKKIMIFHKQKEERYYRSSDSSNSSNSKKEEFRTEGCQVLGAILYSKQGPTYELPTLKHIDPSDIEIQGPLHPLVEECSMKGDSAVLKIMLSKFMRKELLHDKMHVLNILYHIENNKQLITTGVRVNQMIPTMYQSEWIWYLWQIILKQYQHQDHIYPILSSLYFLCCYDYSKSKKKSKQCILINVLILITTPKHQIQWNQGVFDDQRIHIIQKACQNINVMYDDIGSMKHSTSPSPSFPSTTTAPPPYSSSLVKKDDLTRRFEMIDHLYTTLN